MKQAGGPIMKAIRREAQAMAVDPVVEAKAKMLGALRREDQVTAFAAMSEAAHAGGSWAEIAFALDIVTPQTDDEYRRLVLAKLRQP